MISFRKGPIRIGEVWFDQPVPAGVDLIRHQQRARPVQGARCAEFRTLLIELDRPEEEIFNEVKKDTRNEIRRAGSKDQLVVASHGGDAARTAAPAFLEFFNAFARQKGLPELGQALLDGYLDAGVLDLSSAGQADGTVLVWHAYYRDAARVRLLYSASLFRETPDSAFRNLVGRANRFLHWEDMRRFKASGLRQYDFGGWYGGATDKEKLSINRFKGEFGGRVVKTFNCEEGVTIKGRLFLEAKHRLRRPSAGTAGARYLVRFDDVCPTMNWAVWNELEKILIEADVKPLLAVVPANEDDQLKVAPPEENFWERVRGWQARGWGIGLHGYQHRYVTHEAGLVPLNDRSEFAGVPAPEQAEKLRRAVEIFQREKVRPDVWIAPGHSFDATTLSALREVGIDVVSDGFFFSPHFDRAGMLWIPQQLWGFHYRPFGLWTVCCHPNDWTDGDLARFRRELAAYKDRITSPYEVTSGGPIRSGSALDRILSQTWMALHLRKVQLGGWAKKRFAGTRQS